MALKWTPPETDGGSPITNYVVQYRPISATQWIQANEAFIVPDTTFSVTGLRENAEYVFRVAAENRAGAGEPSSPTKPVKVVKPLGKIYCLFSFIYFFRLMKDIYHI